MEQATLIGRADVRVAVLPARAAYLVKAGDRQAALTAVREASTRWAGATEPIIPVRANGRIDGRWTQVVELANVDGLVNVNLPAELVGSIGARLGLPVVEIAHIDRHGTTRFNTHPTSIRSNSGLNDALEDAVADAVEWSLPPEDADLWQCLAAGD